MKQYLIDFFRYNKQANLTLLEVIKQLPEKDEAVGLFSHMIAAQEKWRNRITHEVEDIQLPWTNQVFPVDQLESLWTESCNKWIAILETKNESEIESDIEFIRQHDGQKMAAKLRDIVLQVNYHSIHHRAQINKLIRQQGITPPTTDYILTALKEV